MHLAYRNTLLQRLEDRRIDQDLARKWVSYARPQIRLIRSEMIDTDTTEPGSSKFGGDPDMPAGMAWPTRRAYDYVRKENDYRPASTWQERPLQFLAQIHLQDVKKTGCDLPLPSTGLLLFFYDSEVQPWGFDPCDAPGWQVVYVPDVASTCRQSSPAGGNAKVRPVALEASQGLPGWEWIYEATGEPDENRLEFILAEWDKLTDDDLADLFYDAPTFGGWPSPIQQPMELECEMVSNGVYAGDGKGYSDPRITQFRQRAPEWRLLLQIDSDEDLDWMWGDGGMVYFLCREDDIAHGRFERVWTILQCT